MGARPLFKKLDIWLFVGLITIAVIFRFVGEEAIHFGTENFADGDHFLPGDGADGGVINASSASAESDHGGVDGVVCARSARRPENMTWNDHRSSDRCGG